MDEAGVTSDPLLAPFEWRGMRFEFADKNYHGDLVAFVFDQPALAQAMGGNLRVVDCRKSVGKFSASAGCLPNGFGPTPRAALDDWRKKCLGHALHVVALLMDHPDADIEARPRE